MVPLEAKKFYQSLDAVDKTVLERVLNKSASYKSIGEVLSDVRGNSSKLYDKLVEIVVQTRDTFAKLKPEARTFMEQVIAECWTILPKNFFFVKNK